MKTLKNWPIFDVTRERIARSEAKALRKAACHPNERVCSGIHQVDLVSLLGSLPPIMTRSGWFLRDHV